MLSVTSQSFEHWRKQPQGSIRQEAGWTPVTFGTLWNRDSLVLTDFGNDNSGDSRQRRAVVNF